MTRAATALAREVSALFEPVFARLEKVAEAIVASRAGAGAGWCEADLEGVRQLLLELIADDALHVGMGFVAAPGAIEGRHRYMHWWQQHQDRTTRLRLNFDQTSIDMYDYVEMDWFRLPSSSRLRVAVGPYIDYSGSELYIVTASVPVLAEDAVIGIAGADLLSRELERRLQVVLGDAPADAVIVNSDRQVVVSNSPSWVPGMRLPAMPAIGDVLDGRTLCDVAETPIGIGWSVAVLDP